MSDPQELAEQMVAAAFGRGSDPLRPVTEADQETARAFGRKVPELTSVSETAATPEAEMEALLQEFRQLRVSRRGDPPASANAAGIRERAAIVDHLKSAEGQVVVRDRRALARLRMRVEEMRAELPLSAGSSVTEAGGAAPGGREVTAAEVDEAVASAFGRETKGQA